MNKQEWKKVKLGEVAEIVGGSTPKTNIPEYWDGENYWITPAELKGEKFIAETERKITDFAIEKTNLNLLPVGTVLLTSRAPIGKVAISTSPMYCNQGFKNIVCGKDLFNEYVYYWLSYKKDYLNSLGRGATFKEISKTIVENISIPLPPIETQRQIVSELDLLGTIISKKKQQLAELDRLASATFHETFGDPVENEKQWPVKKLGEICTVGSSKRVFVNELQEKGVPFYRGTEIGSFGEGKKISPEFYITSEHYKELKEYTGIPKIGDLLLPSICPDGRIWVVDTEEPFYFKDGRVLWIHLNKDVFCGEYLRFYLKSKFAVDYDKIASGTTFKELKIFALQDLKVIIPPSLYNKPLQGKSQQLKR